MSDLAEAPGLFDRALRRVTALWREMGDLGLLGITVPEDIRGMHAAVGVLTERGGTTSHAAVIARGLYIASQAQDGFGRLLAGSLALTMFVYVFVNVGMVIGQLPVVGVPLPFKCGITRTGDGSAGSRWSITA